MKKWIIALLAVIIVVLFAGYIIVPEQTNLTQTIRIKCTNAAANRYLMHETNWLKWWPVKSSAQKHGSQNQADSFFFNGYTYVPTQKKFNGVGILIKSPDVTVNSSLLLVPLNKDSITMLWQGNLNGGNSPVTRFQRYRQANVIKRNMAQILTQLKNFLEKDENVYGIDIQKTTVKDTLLIVTRQMFNTPPSTENIYSLINKLTIHIQQQSAQQTGYPMLNIRNNNNTHFETMVALPVNKEVKETKDIVKKRMVPGNILVAEVRGGPGTAANAFAQMENYLLDHHLESPAIPFYSLITNRQTEPDTTKWITRINYPVF